MEWRREAQPSQVGSAAAACAFGSLRARAGWLLHWLEVDPTGMGVDPTAQVWVDLGGGTGHNVELMSESSWRMNANACVACCDCCACLVACP